MMQLQLLHSGHWTQQEPMQVLLLVPPPVLWLLLLLHRRPLQVPLLLLHGLRPHGLAAFPQFAMLELHLELLLHLGLTLPFDVLQSALCEDLVAFIAHESA